MMTRTLHDLAAADACGFMHQEDEAELLSQALELSLAEEKERQQMQQRRRAAQARPAAGGAGPDSRDDYIPPSVADMSAECVLARAAKADARAAAYSCFCWFHYNRPTRRLASVRAWKYSEQTAPDI
jgi:hypothetical protein